MALNPKNQVPSLDDDGSLTDFLPEFELRVKQAAKLVPEPETDDEDLKWVRTPAPNAIEWTVGAQWLNSPTTYQYYRQYQVIRDYFELRCPVCNPMDPESMDCWNKSRLYLEGEALLTWNNDIGMDVCPKCKTTRAEFVEDGLFKEYNQLHGVVGMRGGKTATTSIIASYLEHRIYNFHYSTVGGISQYFHQMPNQPFEVAFIASSDVQSQDTIWAHYMARRLQSPWIQRYIQWIKKREREAPKLQGVKQITYDELEKEITNSHLNLKFVSLNSNSSGMAGRTRILAFIDELSRFQNTESRLSADEAYRVLENSLTTVRSMVKRYKLPSFFGSMFSISSPISIEDKSMRLLKQASELKKMYAFHYPTWEFNPYVTREDLQDSYVKDNLGAERDYGANPPNANNPLIDDPRLFRRLAVDQNLTPSAEMEYYRKTDATGIQYSAARCKDAQLRTDVERFVVFDAGLTFDTFAGAAAHGEWVDSPDGPVWVTVYDWVLRVLPQKVPVRLEVWFDSVIDIMDTIKTKHRISMVEFDRWNSAQLIQNIRNKGINAAQKGTTVQDFIKFTADAFFGRVRLLPPDGDELDKLLPHQLSGPGCAIYELTRLERDPALKKVFNPKKGEQIGWNSDDVAQCIVHAHRLVQEVQGAADAQDAARSPEKRLRNEQVGGAVWGRSSTGSVFHPKAQVGRGW